MSRKKKARKREAVAERDLCEPVALALPQGWGSWLVPVLIALVTFIAFLTTLRTQLVDCDYFNNFLDSPYFRWLAWTQLRWMWSTYLGHYIPLACVMFGLDYL